LREIDYHLWTQYHDNIGCSSTRHQIFSHTLFLIILKFGSNRSITTIGLFGSIESKSFTHIKRSKIHDYLLSEAKRLSKAGKDQFETNAQLRYIRALFNFAIDDLEIIDQNPTKKIKFYGTTKNLKYIPPERHLQMVCEWSLPHQQELIVFVRESACRISEALRATGADIDTKMNLLTLWTRKKRYGDLTPRRIPLPWQIAKMKRKGKLFGWDEYPRYLEKACRTIGIKPFGWHAYRHRKASLMAMDRRPITEIQHYLGHESIAITSKYLQLLGFNGY
jgi:integrase